MTILDIGCGWGKLLNYITSKYKLKGVGITVSEEQKKYAEENYDSNNLSIEVIDYRVFCADKNNHKKFDRIVSVGMFEHVGYKNYSDFFSCVKKVLKDDGLFLLHTIGSNTSITRTNQWLDKYIFPNGMCPSIKQIGEAIENKFIMEDWHNFGNYYADTLQAWYERTLDFYQKTDNPKYDIKFQRMFKFYLLSSKAQFRTRKSQLWQIILSPNGIKGVVERQQ